MTFGGTPRSATPFAAPSQRYAHDPANQPGSAQVEIDHAITTDFDDERLGPSAGTIAGRRLDLPERLECGVNEVDRATGAVRPKPWCTRAEFLPGSRSAADSCVDVIERVTRFTWLPRHRAEALVDRPANAFRAHSAGRAETDPAPAYSVEDRRASPRLWALLDASDRVSRRWEGVEIRNLLRLSSSCASPAASRGRPRR